MLKISKKFIACISCFSISAIIGSTFLASYALKNQGNQSKRIIDPLGRGSNYRHYPLSYKIMESDRLNALIDKIEVNKMIVYVINENTFINNIKSIAQAALKASPIFNKTFLSYNFICNYQIKNASSILVDLVWYQVGNKIRYYDQFVLTLQTI